MKKDEFLDRPIPGDYLEEWTTRVAMPKAAVERKLGSVLVFRIGAEWLGLESRVVEGVTEAGRIHRLPQHRSRIVLGVVNVRGQLVACVSLQEFLHLAAPGGSAGEGSLQRRLIVLEDGGLRLAFAADEVQGICPYHQSDVQPLRSTLSGTRYTAAVLSLQGKSVACLHTADLVAALRASLS